MEQSKRNEIQNEAFNICMKHHRTGLAISVGVGKTRIGIRHIKYMLDKSTTLFPKVLVVAPKKSIFESWKNEFKELKLENLLEHVEFVTYRSLPKKNPASYDSVYLDECHNLTPSHLPFLSEYKNNIVGLTGTPPRYKNSKRGQIIQVYCPIRYSYITDDAVEDGVLNDYTIVVHPIQLSERKNFPVTNKKTGGVFYTTEVDNYKYWENRISMAGPGKPQMMTRVMRMKAMMEYRSKEDYAKDLLNMIDDKCIIFANTTDQADRLSEYSYHSKNNDSKENLEKFGTGEIDSLSCVLQISEGVNIPNLKSAIILHAYGNEKKLMQRLGRLMRLKPDEKATIHILMFEGTQDQNWVEQALADFDQSKIVYFDN
jgi:superfamily II DNA or RNA helicase